MNEVVLTLIYFKNMYEILNM